jgi:hypothetical protein
MEPVEIPEVGLRESPLVTIRLEVPHPVRPDRHRAARKGGTWARAGYFSADRPKARGSTIRSSPNPEVARVLT